MRCHGNGAISHSPNKLFLEDNFFCLKLVPVNNMVPMKNSPVRVQGMSKLTADLVLCLNLANDKYRIEYIVDAINFFLFSQ